MALRLAYSLSQTLNSASSMGAQAHALAEPHVLSFANSFGSSLPYRVKFTVPCKKGQKFCSSTAIAFFTRTTSFFDVLRHPTKPTFQGCVVGGVRFDGPNINIEDIEDVGLVFENFVTRTLPPALTLEEGLDKIKEALANLKSDPPRSSSGLFRFQVLVPPSPKALRWFCCQPESSGVYPLMFISKNPDNYNSMSLHVNPSRGVFGVGTAVYFTPSSYESKNPFSVKRYISTDSQSTVAYGFLDVTFTNETFSMRHDDGSFYFFVPQIELDEQESISVLTATLAWDDFSHCVLEEALQHLEFSLNQVFSNRCATTSRFDPKSLRSSLDKLGVVHNASITKIYMNILSREAREMTYSDIMKHCPTSNQFCFRISPTLTVAENMFDEIHVLSHLMRGKANINAVWASLIVEECSRLGLMYFCIAPGSRSSPLAVAASSHPLITCISCYDERSLAFHAIGYARGSHNPAVVITSSGTAVSNLLPAVVEASQDFIPLVLLTADRPPELQEAGANQAINQVNHFGSFIRFFFSLPSPTDEVPARMVLTTIDSAVQWATCSPCGPVHINCPFREPLDDSPRNWMSNCLHGLDFWMSNGEPFTKYINVTQAHDIPHYQMIEVLNLIDGARNGLLLIGALHTEDEIWTALLLAKHLHWPIVADILSGLRLRKFLTSCPPYDGNFLFVDHLDHVLLSHSVRDWLEMDVIIQIGSRITSKRIHQMLEKRNLCSYVMVDSHPFRHDPTHIVTHRIQSTVADFSRCVLKAKFKHKEGKWNTSLNLQVLSMMVEWEIQFQILTEHSLTEPLVACAISEALTCEHSLFIGNSMPIRDTDMYGRNWSKGRLTATSLMVNSKIPWHWTRVSGNRGASGIDGLLSSAIGFAVGCNKRVLCVIGDISFLHDTNGLSILKQRIARKPIVVVVINNLGGAIFSLLPIANVTEPKVMEQYFYTSHNISISSLCMAHGLKHVTVQTKTELEDALSTSQNEQFDSVIEIKSSIDATANFHRVLQKFASQTAEATLRLISGPLGQGCCHNALFHFKVEKLEFSKYRIALCAPPTSRAIDHNCKEFYREGFIISLSLEEGTKGYGEVAPLEIHEESLKDAEEQLRFLVHVLDGARIGLYLPLLKGSFSHWIWNELGIPPTSIFPSVRCGLEMAILNAIACKQGSNLLNIIHPYANKVVKHRNLSKVQICALIESNGTPSEVAQVASKLVNEGFSAIKLKVARGHSPKHYGAVIREVRKEVGFQIKIRADANRNWTYEEAIEFSSFVKGCDLQYIEEPVRDEADLLNFCEESGLPVALDETIANFRGNPLKGLTKYVHPGIVAVVIKPSVLGGFENAAFIARWAQQLGKLAVLSATFESSLGLSTYILFCCYLDIQNTEICTLMDKKQAPLIAHGLGTYSWLKEDVTIKPLKISHNPDSGFVEASALDANQLLHDFQLNNKSICTNFPEEMIRAYQLTVELKDLFCLVNVKEIGHTSHDTVLVFLHGFLGTGEDWIPIMKAISGSVRCIAVDLPGHGGSVVENHCAKDNGRELHLSIEVIAQILHELVQCITSRKVIFVGYSMGARIALYMALKFSDLTKGAVVISGSPGLKDKAARKVRAAKDASRAQSLLTHGLSVFLENWYAGDLWESLRNHPHFNQIVSSRLQNNDAESLANILSGLSVGRQSSLWGDLEDCRKPLMLIYGERDTKFKNIAYQMLNTVHLEHGHLNDIKVIGIPDCGHAAHLENPLLVVRALSHFITGFENGKM